METNKITYKEYDYYFIFSDDPEHRVYLGNIPPEDYIQDTIHQTKRSESCHYYDLETGEKVSQETVFDHGGMIWRGPSFDGDTPERQNCKYGYKCDYDFKRKVRLVTYSMNSRSASYNPKDPDMKRRATAYAFDKTLEEQDTWDQAWQKKKDEINRKNPSLINLMMVGGEQAYYTDWDGNRITPEEHVKMVKERYGEDVFEKARQRWEEETPDDTKNMIKKLVEDITNK